jgi:hypothetical protein
MNNSSRLPLILRKILYGVVTIIAVMSGFLVFKAFMHWVYFPLMRLVS